MIHQEQINDKLTILFVMDKLEMAINEDILVEICSTKNWVPPLYAKETIIKLIESNFVNRLSSQNQLTLLTLTPDGRNCLSYFFNDIPISKREDIMEYIKKNRLTFRKRQEYFCDYFRNDDGSFTINLKIFEITKSIVDIKLVVPTRAIATSIYNSWTEKAPDVYTALHEILIEN